MCVCVCVCVCARACMHLNMHLERDSWLILLENVAYIVVYLFVYLFILVVYLIFKFLMPIFTFYISRNLSDSGRF